jgi:hypothetical protein
MTVGAWGMRLLQCCKKKERKPREDSGICMLYLLARKLFGQDVGKESEDKMTRVRWCW